MLSRFYEFLFGRNLRIKSKMVNHNILTTIVRPVCSFYDYFAFFNDKIWTETLCMSKNFLSENFMSRPKPFVWYFSFQYF
jgi:hypothetical protein